MQAFLRFLATLVPLFEAGRAWLRRRRLLVLSALVILCGCCAAGSGAGPTIPPLPVLTSLRPLTLDGIEGAWMDWRDAGTLDAWLESVEAAP